MNNKNQSLHKMHRISMAALCALPLASCTGHGIREAALPTRIDYRCSNNRVLQVQRTDNASTATVVIDGKPVTLQRESISAAQEKYTDGTYRLYLQGERAMLEENSLVLFGSCNAGHLPTVVRDGFTDR